jgi:hypothetical protein
VDPAVVMAERTMWFSGVAAMAIAVEAVREAAGMMMSCSLSLLCFSYFDELVKLYKCYQMEKIIYYPLN